MENYRSVEATQLVIRQYSRHGKTWSPIRVHQSEKWPINSLSTTLGEEAMSVYNTKPIVNMNYQALSM